MTSALNYFILAPMIQVHKYEAVGIAVSVGAMALALFLMRVNGNFDSAPAAVASGSQSASVIMSENGVEGAGAALSEALSGGRVTKLVVTDVVLGRGKEVKKGDSVEVNYIGTLQNGQEFDNSYKKGSSFTFTVGDKKVIAGWNEGMMGMKEGGQRIIVVPSEMAYGSKGYGPIPGNATVVYAIELISVR